MTKGQTTNSPKPQHDYIEYVYKNGTTATADIARFVKRKSTSHIFTKITHKRKHPNIKKISIYPIIIIITNYSIYKEHFTEKEKHSSLTHHTLVYDSPITPTRKQYFITN